MLLTDKYSDKIYGTITCYDRMIIQSYIPSWSHAYAMTAYMKLNAIRIFDYSNFSQPLTEQVRHNEISRPQKEKERTYRGFSSYKYLVTALGKEIITAGLTVKNLILVPALTS